MCTLVNRRERVRVNGEILASHFVEEIHEIATDLKSNTSIILDNGKRISKIVTELQDKTQKAKAGELELGEVDEHDFNRSDKL